jgi:antitoxin component YwqK of YwqJK toxin-antitoxin module
VGGPPPKDFQEYCEKRGDDGVVRNHGPYRTWFRSNGQLETSGQYERGQKVGSWKTYTAKGTLQSESTFLAGELNGETKAWNAATGALLERVHYKDGKRDGERTTYHSNGRRARVEQYVRGELQGLAQEWDEKGHSLGRMLYENGAPTDGTLLFPSGAPRLVAKLSGGTLTRSFFYRPGQLEQRDELDTDGNGTTETWHANGQRRWTAHMKAGKLDGLVVGYDESGRKRLEVTFRSNVQHGPYRQWAKSGKQEADGTYENDRRAGKWRIWNEVGQKVAEVTYGDHGGESSTTLYYGNGVRKLRAAHLPGGALTSRTEFDAQGRKVEHYDCDAGIVVKAEFFYYDLSGKPAHVEENEVRALGQRRPCERTWDDPVRTATLQP